MPLLYLFSFGVNDQIGDHSTLEWLLGFLGDVEDGRTKGMPLEPFRLEVLDEEKEGHDTLYAIEQLSEAAVR